MQIGYKFDPHEPEKIWLNPLDRDASDFLRFLRYEYPNVLKEMIRISEKSCMNWLKIDFKKIEWDVIEIPNLHEEKDKKGDLLQ